jgi:alanine racemase
MTAPTRVEVAERGHPVWAEIDLGAIRHNIRSLRERAAGAEVMGVVKGYAYGHGNPASAIAMLQGGATRLGVARIAEAIHLRDAGIDVPIHLFTEPPPEALASLLEAHVNPTVYSEGFAQALSDAAIAAGMVAHVHVKIDTGMHRVGLQLADVPDAVRVMDSLPGIAIEGVWSHLAVADHPDHPFTKTQLERFTASLDALSKAGVEPRFKHLANSAATIAYPETHFNMVRCGIASYGLWPGPHMVGTIDLKPALALKARVNMVKPVAAGEALSYGLRYELPRDSRVVTLPVGYADGYDRRLSGTAEVLIGGVRHRVSGTVCMDQFMIDVHDQEVATGDLVTLIGKDGDEEVTAEELAGLVGTINYEVTTRIPSRVPRVFLGEEEA